MPTVTREMRVADALQALARCMYCGASDGGDVDHIVPAARGGSDETPNLCHSCERCNRSKSDGHAPLGAPVVDVWIGRLLDEGAMKRARIALGGEWTEEESLDRAAAFRVSRCREWHDVRAWSAPKRRREPRCRQ